MHNPFDNIEITSSAEQAAVEQFKQRLEYLSIPAKTVLLREGEVVLHPQGLPAALFLQCGKRHHISVLFRGERGGVVRQLAQAATEPILAGEYRAYRPCRRAA